MAFLTLFACQKNEQGEHTDTLEVSPSGTIAFAATGNSPVTLTVTTDADSWDYSLSDDWIEATKEENTLVVNVQDNTSSFDLTGSISFTAGNAESVVISVTQEAGSPEEIFSGGRLRDASSEGKDIETGVSFTSLNEVPETAVELKVVLSEAQSEDVVVSIEYDASYLNEFILSHDNMECELFPESALSFSSSTITVAAGSLESESITVTLDTDADGIFSATTYLIPVYVAEAQGVEFSSANRRVNYLFKRTLEKEVKNVVYFETNNTNPLNALEYLLEDGTPFFDAVVLFSGNINYNSSEDLVYLSKNTGITALLDGTDTFLQPLRNKGIKVYLGILGNWDQAGVAQLSDEGAKRFAADVALEVLEYKIDGVSLDDEYSTTPDTGNWWFTTPSNAAGSRLCYELKQAMSTTVTWETEVSVFRYGNLTSLVSVDGYEPGTFVDFWVGNYGSSTSPAAGMTYKQCSFASIECNAGYGRTYATESNARSAKEGGYGWCMWFAFDPSGTGGISNNYSTTFNYMNNVALGLYDMEIQVPSGVYHKTSNGYDPTRYDFNP